MKVLFIGLGSIGSRHMRNLSYVLESRGESCSFHALRSSRNRLPDSVGRFVERQFFSVDEIEKEYDAIFITNPTHLHYETLKKTMGHSKKYFIEKPVFHTTKIDWNKLEINSDVICYVAAPLRYTKVYSCLERELSNRPCSAARAICSSYLPDWRPGTDYRQCYSAHKQEGGDVSLELIHEWDYIVQLFGFPQQVLWMSGRYSQLEIDSDDLALYIARYPDKLVSLSLDYFGRKSRREIEIFLEDDVMVADFVGQEIRFLRNGKTISLAEERDDWQRKELEYFLDLSEDRENWNTIRHAFSVLQITKGEHA